MKIIVAGDWHGNLRWARYILELASNHADEIIQVGDFGFWEHQQFGVEYLDGLSETAQSLGIDVVWLDGNHENHWLLPMYLDGGKNFTEKTAEGFYRIRPGIYYSPRGNIWTWGNKTFATVGGAPSIDKQRRVVGESWWPEEVLTHFELSGIPKKKVDFLFTHDAPTSFPYPLKDDLESTAHRQLMNVVGEKLNPEIWFHGHYHVMSTYYHRALSFVVSLGMDGTLGNAVILDTENNSVGTLTGLRT